MLGKKAAYVGFGQAQLVFCPIKIFMNQGAALGDTVRIVSVIIMLILEIEKNPLRCYL